MDFFSFEAKAKELCGLEASEEAFEEGQAEGDD